MWREQDSNGQMSERKICPIISDSRGRVLRQGRNCYSAYSQVLMAETFWFCTIIDGPVPVHKPDGEGQSRSPGEHEQ